MLRGRDQYTDVVVVNSRDHSMYTPHEYYVPDQSVYIYPKNTTSQPLLVSCTEPYFSRKTAFAEMASFKEASVNIIGFDKEKR